MENNKNYFNTYRFYNRKGQRLSIFATTKPGMSSEGVTCGLSIYIVRHSKSPDPVTKQVDKFSKKWVRGEFEKGQLAGSFTNTEIDPVIINMPCTEGDSKKVFMDYCNRNFYKLDTNTMYGTNMGLQFDSLVKRGFDGQTPEAIILPSSIRRVKTITEQEFKDLYQSEQPNQADMEAAWRAAQEMLKGFNN